MVKYEWAIIVGIPIQSPVAVVIRASPILPARNSGRLIPPADIVWKAPIIPLTVPSNPMMGETVVLGCFLGLLVYQILRSNGRGDWIRTNDLLVPNQALYQAKLRPEKEGSREV